MKFFFQRHHLFIWSKKLFPFFQNQTVFSHPFLDENRIFVINFFPFPIFVFFWFFPSCFHFSIFFLPLCHFHFGFLHPCHRPCISSCLASSSSSFSSPVHRPNAASATTPEYFRIQYPPLKTGASSPSPPAAGERQRLPTLDHRRLPAVNPRRPLPPMARRRLPAIHRRPDPASSRATSLSRAPPLLPPARAPPSRHPWPQHSPAYQRWPPSNSVSAYQYDPTSFTYAPLPPTSLPLARPYHPYYRPTPPPFRSPAPGVTTAATFTWPPGVARSLAGVVGDVRPYPPPHQGVPVFPVKQHDRKRFAKHVSPDANFTAPVAQDVDQNSRQPRHANDSFPLTAPLTASSSSSAASSFASTSLSSFLSSFCCVSSNRFPVISCLSRFNVVAFLHLFLLFVVWTQTFF